MRLNKGQYLGFRRGADTWLVRMRDISGKQNQSALPSVTEYDDAKQAAEKLLRAMGAAPVRNAARGTVREALKTYLQWLRDQGRERTAKTIEPKFKKLVWDDPLADIPLYSLVREDVKGWRERLRDGRQPRSVNRIVRDLQAGLNRARKEGHVSDPASWTLDPLADDVDDSGLTAIILTPVERKALIEAATREAAEFMRGLELTGARPSELSAATVGDLDSKHGTLLLMHRKGRPAKLRPRSVVLSREGVAFFKKQSKNKLSGTWLFLDPDGRPWERKKWAEEIRSAAATVNTKARGRNRIPPGASAYSFRHARISELLQVHRVDPLTVAPETEQAFCRPPDTYKKTPPKRGLLEKYLRCSGLRNIALTTGAGCITCTGRDVTRVVCARTIGIARPIANRARVGLARIIAIARPFANGVCVVLASPVSVAGTIADGSLIGLTRKVRMARIVAHWSAIVPAGVSALTRSFSNVAIVVPAVVLTACTGSVFNESTILVTALI